MTEMTDDQVKAQVEADRAERERRRAEAAENVNGGKG